MLRLCSRTLPDLPILYAPQNREICKESPLPHSTQGSQLNNGKDQVTLMGTAAKMTGQKGGLTVLWLPFFPSRSTSPGHLPRDKTKGKCPFQVIGVNFPQPIKYQVGPKRKLAQKEDLTSPSM